jgi:hypothetical protein
MSSVNIDFNEDLFEKSMVKFFEFCEKILVYSHTIGTSPNPILVKMNKFKKVYDMMDSDEKQEIVNLCLFEPHKKELLQKDDEEFRWMKDKSVVIAIPGAKGNNKDKAVYCSSVFTKCVKLKNEAEKAIEGLPDSAAEDREELNFVDIFALYYYRILKYSVTFKSDNEKICIKVADIEKDLGLNTNNDIEIKSNPAAIANSMGALGNMNMGNLGNNLGNIMQSIGPALNGILKQGPNGEMNINGSGVKNVVDKLIDTVGSGNQELKKKAGELMSGFSECKNPQEALSVALNKLGNQEVKDAISKGLGGIGVNMEASNPITDSEIKQLQIGGSSPSSDINPSDQE